MENDNEYEELRKKLPDFVDYIEKKYKNDLLIVGVVWVVSLAIVILAMSFLKLKSQIQLLAILYSLIGSTFWAIGAFKTPRLIVPLSVSRIGYNKSVADEYLKTSKEVGIGIFLILLSILMQVYLFS